VDVSNFSSRVVLELNDLGSNFVAVYGIENSFYLGAVSVFSPPDEDVQELSLENSHFTEERIQFESHHGLAK
jgi:hypothetical protein